MLNIGERDETSECADTVKVCWTHCGGVVLLVVAVVWCGVVWCGGASSEQSCLSSVVLQCFSG